MEFIFLSLQNFIWLQRQRPSMPSSILIGGAAACVAILGCGIASRSWSRMKRLSRLTGTSPFVYWPKGPFEVPMGRREAAKILSVSPFASAGQIKEAHRRIMLLNHPDRGGSPFLALKINEAKELLTRENQ